LQSVVAVACSFGSAAAVTEASDSASVVVLCNDATRCGAQVLPTAASWLRVGFTPPHSSDIGSGIGTSSQLRK
jgi:hypothetical protein